MNEVLNHADRLDAEGNPLGQHLRWHRPGVVATFHDHSAIYPYGAITLAWNNGDGSGVGYDVEVVVETGQRMGGDGILIISQDGNGSGFGKEYIGIPAVPLFSFDVNPTYFRTHSHKSGTGTGSGNQAENQDGDGIGFPDKARFLFNEYKSPMF